ncbi:MAG: Cof-type HAD-IIB family hydrolase [Lachnospiraceae bacterium]|nr:Cof-type HAD-IIB family hydrolase [Lachnospiraceae bacterium]
MKAVFFDIDGTLWDNHAVIPQSTKVAIKKLKENGYLSFICSGRTRSFIYEPELLNLGFDGIVAGCGTYIEEHGKEIFYKGLTTKEIEKALGIFRMHHLPVVMEGKYYMYLDEAEFEDKNYTEKMKKQMGESLQPITGNEGKWEISKFTCHIKDGEVEPVIEKLKDEYEIMIHEVPMAEFVPKGYSKASGIKKACELLDIKWEDTYAFGDSVNDLAMLRYVAHGIAMGNGSKAAKEAAEYVTSDIHEDGIYKGLQHYGLI